MDVDFANMYVQKQRDLITEMTNKILMLETHVALFDKQLKDATQSSSQATAQVEQLTAELKATKEEGAKLQKELAIKTKEAEELRARENTLVVQVDGLKKLAMNTLAPPEKKPSTSK